MVSVWVISGLGLLGRRLLLKAFLHAFCYVHVFISLEGLKSSPSGFLKLIFNG